MHNGKVTEQQMFHATIKTFNNEVISMKDVSMKDLKNAATKMRMKVIDMIYKAQSGHPGGSLSAADFVTGDVEQDGLYQAFETLGLLGTRGLREYDAF